MEEQVTAAAPSPAEEAAGGGPPEEGSVADSISTQPIEGAEAPAPAPLVLGEAPAAAAEAPAPADAPAAAEAPAPARDSSPRSVAADVAAEQPTVDPLGETAAFQDFRREAKQDALRRAEEGREREAEALADAKAPAVVSPARSVTFADSVRASPSDTARSERSVTFADPVQEPDAPTGTAAPKTGGALDGMRLGETNAFGFAAVECDEVVINTEDPTVLELRAAVAVTVGSFAAARASVARTAAVEAFHGANLAKTRVGGRRPCYFPRRWRRGPHAIDATRRPTQDNRSAWTGLLGSASHKAKQKSLMRRRSRVTALPPARNYDTSGTERRRARDQEILQGWWAAETPPWEQHVARALDAVQQAPVAIPRRRPASAAVDIAALAAAAVPRRRPRTAPAKRQVAVALRPKPRPAPPPDDDWPLPALLQPRVARHREAMASARRAYKFP